MSPTIAAAELAHLHFRALEHGDAQQAAASIHPDHVNHEAPDHPPASALPGIPGFLATSAWLRLAFSELRFEVHDLVTEGDRTIAHVTMSGRQDGPFVVFPPGGTPVAFPATGATFAVRQCHLFTIHEGLHASHAAVRDDLGMLTQLGHLPPGPGAIARMARWKLGGGSRRAVARAVEVADEAASAWPVRHSPGGARGHRA
jgi:predicted ester cyclase